MFWELIFSQTRHSWKKSLLVLIAMTSLVSLYAYVLNTGAYAQRSMQLIMKNMGLNQRLVPESVDTIDSLLCSDKQKLFPEETTETLASHVELPSRYYLSVLQEQYDAGGRKLILTGIKPVERPDDSAEKGNPAKPVKKGTVRLGYESSKVLDVHDGSAVEIYGNNFDVAKVDDETGDIDDWRVYMNLSDTQRILKKPGKINCILSFECLFPGGDMKHIHEYQRTRLEKILPGFKQINLEKIAIARHLSRNMTDSYLYFVSILVTIVMLAVIVINGIQEVEDRKYETGILLAVGAGYCRIIALHCVKMLALALIAGVAGFLLGTYASLWTISPFLITNTKQFAVNWHYFCPTMLIIGATAIIGEIIPVSGILRINPAIILTEQ